MDCEGNPAQCLTLRNRSSSAAATNLPSRTRAAEESPWKALRPRMIMPESASYLQFRQMTAQCIDDLRALPDQEISSPEEHGCRLRLLRLHRHKPHRRALCGLTDSLGVGPIVLLSLHKRPHISGSFTSCPN